MSSIRRLADLAVDLDARVVGDGELEIHGVRPLDSAQANHLSFLHNPKYVEEARTSKAGAILVDDENALPGRTVVVCDEPYLGLARALEIFHPRQRPRPGIHETAVVADDVSLGDGASIGPLASVGAGSSIGADTVIGAGSMVGMGVTIGAGTELRPRVVVEDGCRIGNRCIIHSGTVVGSDGYGFATVDGIHHKVPQVGIVVVEDEVELGANVCIDRAALGETRIGRGTKVDNLVQIAHNVQIGEHCLLVSQSGISGSTRVGRHVIFAGQAGAAGHLTIGDGAVLMARAAAYKDVPAGEAVAGEPARPRREWLKTAANVQRLDQLKVRVKELEARLADLEEKT